MKKFVLVLLLALLPLQASWGVVSAYVVQEHDACLHPCSEIQKAKAGQADERGSTAASFHHEDRFCGLHALGIVETYPPQIMPVSSSLATEADEPQPLRRSPIERPERPKWVASA